MEILISTVICTYNRADILATCLDYVKKQTCDPSLFEVIIVNNNSSDHTEFTVQEFIQKYTGEISFQYFFEPKQGLSAARNKGIKEANGKYVNFIDDDALIPPGYLSSLVKYVTKNPDWAGIGGKIMPKYFTKEPDWMSFYTWGLVSKHDLGMEAKPYTSIGLYPTGCNMTYKKNVLSEVGGFDEELLRRCDDKYIAYEIKKKHYDIWYVPEVALEHFIDEDRITNRLESICIDSGFHERLRLRHSSIAKNMIKLLEYLFKMGAAIFLCLYFIATKQKNKGLILLKMRWWFIKGFLRK